MDLKYRSERVRLHGTDPAVAGRHHLGSQQAGPGGHGEDRHQRERRQGPRRRAGTSLLPRSRSQKIFLPSACGGGGTCAQCKCKVLDGGGTHPAHRDRLHLASRGARKALRLACQVKVKQRPEDPRSRPRSWRSRSWRLHRPLEPQRGHLHQGTRRRPAAGRGRSSSRPAATSRSISRRTNSRYRDFDIEREVPPRLGPAQALATHVRNANEPCFRAYSMANYPAERGPHHAQRAHRHAPAAASTAPPGIDVVLHLLAQAGRQGTCSAARTASSSPRTPRREMVYIGGGAGMAPLR